MIKEWTWNCVTWSTKRIGMVVENNYSSRTPFHSLLWCFYEHFDVVVLGHPIEIKFYESKKKLKDCVWKCKNDDWLNRKVTFSFLKIINSQNTSQTIIKSFQFSLRQFMWISLWTFTSLSLSILSSHRMGNDLCVFCVLHTQPH